MIAAIKKLLRQWNRQRLARRQLGKARQYKARLDLAQRRHQLGNGIAGPFPVIAWGVLTHMATTAEQARCLRGIATASAQARGQANSLVLTGDTHHVMMTEAFKTGCGAYIAVDARGAPHPDALTALLQMHMAADGAALIDATIFPQQHPKSFEPNTYDTPWVQRVCMLIPRTLYEQTLGFDPSLPAPQADIALSERARALGFKVKTCPAALYFMTPEASSPAADTKSTGRLSVVCRFHDVRRLSELKRAVFSVACSAYPDIELLIVTQNFTAADIVVVQRAVAAIAQLAQNPPSVQIVNHPCTPGKDARTELLNLGVVRSTGRYLAFLDHDDVIYPEAYGLLIGELAQTQVGIAFGGIVTKHFECFDEVSQLRHTDPLNQQGSLSALFKMNCCPIHSYVIDKSRISAHDLRFDEQLVRYEDYEFLLRICAHHLSSFKHYRTAIGDYYMKDDGSNSTLYLASSASSANQAMWMEAKSRITQRKQEIHLNSAVLEQLKLASPLNPMSIADYNA
ncbi:MAG: glycosyltransferase [Aquabacterium sp.]|uniref:glycosyltransferase n=1 Tax=Aquabacterium sp. TaxID=1872578 RepID=UPI0027237628|nr:glycosyltransferase [Aquabacterium sp.]MDO9006024.1 glycosyltransferase [Aquabacterium sp.]